MLRNLGAVACALIIVVGVGYVVMRPAVPLQSGIDVQSANLQKQLAELSGRAVLNSTEEKSGVVSYAYLGDPVPQRITATEVPELRTANSFTQFEGVAKDGKDPLLTLTTRFYPQNTFAQAGDGSWHTVEHATTSAQVWLSRPRPFVDGVRNLLLPTAWATNVQIYSAVGDGNVIKTSSIAQLCSAARWKTNSTNATTGTSFDYTATVASAEDYSLTGADPASCDLEMGRIFLPFDTSSIPSAATISAASLKAYVTAVTDGGVGDLMTVSRSSQATHTALATTDYSATSTTEGTSSRFLLTTFGGAGYVSFPLNATGITWIAKSGASSNCSGTSGISCFDMVMVSDITNTYPGDGLNVFTMSTSEQTGTSQDPYLDITYTAPASAVTVNSGLRVGANGTLRVVSGGIKIY